MMEVIPKGPRVLVEKVETSSIGQIAIPDQTTELHRWRVLLLGDEKYLPNGERIPFTVEIGDEVMFDTTVKGLCPLGMPWAYGGKTLVIVPIEAIVAVTRGEPGVEPRKIVEARQLAH